MATQVKNPPPPPAAQPPTPAPSAPRRRSTRPYTPVDTSRLPARFRHLLHAVASRHWHCQAVHAITRALAILVSLWIARALADFLFNLPWPARLAFLLAETATFAWILYRYALLPWRHRLNAESAALLIQEKIPATGSLLITTVQLLAPQPRGTIGSSDLLAEAVARAQKALPPPSALPSIVDSRPARLWTLRALAALLALTALGITTWPASGILARRLFLSTEPLPTDTRVFPVTKNARIPAGSSFTLAAEARGHLPRSGRVTLRYPNGERIDIPVTPRFDQPHLFELTLPNLQQPFHYRFTLHDGQGEEYHVQVLTPPSVQNLTLTQTFPEYTKRPPAPVPPGAISLFPGSRVRLQFTPTQPLQSATLRLHGLNQDISLPTSSLITAEFTTPPDALTGLEFLLVNQEGLPSQNNTIYPVTLEQDLPPLLTILQPTADSMALLPRARLTIRYTASDDFALTSCSLNYQITPPSPTPPASPPPTRRIPLPLPTPRQPAEFIWDLAQEPAFAPPGTTVTWWIEAQDNNNVHGPGITTSPQKSFVIVTEEAKIKTFLEDLARKAESIQELSTQQQQINEKTDNLIKLRKP